MNLYNPARRALIGRANRNVAPRHFGLRRFFRFAGGPVLPNLGTIKVARGIYLACDSSSLEEKQRGEGERAKGRCDSGCTPLR